MNEPVRPRIIHFLACQEKFVHVGGIAKGAQVSANSVRKVLRELEQERRLETCPSSQMPGTFMGHGYRLRPGDPARIQDTGQPGTRFGEGGLTDDWKDDPAVRDAMARAEKITGLLALPEEEAQAGLAAIGLHPVSVVHGYLDSDQADDLIGRRMPEVAERLGCRHKRGGNDATTYMFASRDAAVEFLAEVTGFAESWWTVTATARPVYNRGAGR